MNILDSIKSSTMALLGESQPRKPRKPRAQASSQLGDSLDGLAGCDGKHGLGHARSKTGCKRAQAGGRGKTRRMSAEHESGWRAIERSSPRSDLGADNLPCDESQESAH